MSEGTITLTVTGDIGAGQQMNSRVINNVISMNFRVKDGIIDIFSENPPRILAVQFSNLTGITINTALHTVSMTDV